MEVCCIAVFVIVIIAIIAAFGSVVLYFCLVIWYGLHDSVVRIIMALKRKRWEKTIKDKPTTELNIILEDLRLTSQNYKQEIEQNERLITGITDQWRQLKMSNKIDADKIKREDVIEKITLVKSLISTR